MKMRNAKKVMREMKMKNQSSRESSELRGTCGFVAAAILLYLLFLCTVKGHSFVIIGVFLGSLLLSALISALALRLTE